MRLIAFAFFVLLSVSSHSAIWNANNQWDENFEESYRQWMKSPQVYKEIFTSKDSKYYGISADCADAAYALRAIFSRENSLPFAITNPSGSRSASNAISNNIRAFDNEPNEDKRFVKFINYIGESVGSENLTRLDTYSVKIDSINPATMFTYKIKRRFGKAIRHVYTIKNVQETGNFDLIYSTQAIKKDKLPMNYRIGKQLVNPPKDVWGFKRFIWPRHLGKPASSYPSSYSYSQEQFELAKDLGADKFFDHVKKTLQTVEESVDDIITRSLNSLCLEAQARVGYIQQGVDYNREINGRCMNYTEYDTYSTPARDKALKASFEILKKNYKKYKNSISNVDLESLVEDIFEKNPNSPTVLRDYCPVKIDSSRTLNLSQLWYRVRKGKLSSHPNDSLDSRWGEDKGRTKCKVWY